MQMAFNWGLSNMKKRGFVVAAVLLLCLFLIFSDAQGKIKFFMDGYSSYDSDHYWSSYSEMLPLGYLNLDLSRSNSQKLAYKYDKSYVMLESVDYDGYGYNLRFFSYGNFSYDSGELLEFGVPSEKRILQTDKGSIAYCLKGEGPGERHGIGFSLAISPADIDGISQEDLASMKIDLPIYAWMKYYSRR